MLAWACLSWSSVALAYRPFDGTDAAVADVHEVEIEFGPLGYLEQGDDRTIVAPAYVFNYGFAEGWEFVFEGQGEHPVSGDSRTSSLAGNGVFLKGILRPGTLQDAPGPSVATEFGILLPGINADPSTGLSAAGILSQRWPGWTMHLNAQAALLRDGNPDLFLSAIVEGPAARSVRPVGELFYEREFSVSETQSALIGAIWQAGESRAFDVGLRSASVNGQHVVEFRAGLTFGFSV